MSLISRSEILLEMPQVSPLLPASYSTAGAYQRAQLNLLSLEAFLSWLQEEFEEAAKPYPNRATLPSLWEVVNGTALTVDDARIVLLPTQEIAVDELRVPQEWVDIPDWKADYYLLMEVDLEEGWIQIVGFTTHQQIKTSGIYDASDRTYSLDVNDLFQDINSLWIARQFNPQGILRTEVTPLPLLTQPQASNLIERLGNPSIIFPRLEIPFSQWGALLIHGGWRQQLYERRQGLSSTGVPQWLQQGLSSFAQRSGWQARNFVPMVSGSRRSDFGIARTLTITGNSYELKVFPVGTSSSRVWRFELRSSSPGRLIPTGFKLRLLTEDLRGMDNNEDVASTDVESLYIDVSLEPDEGIVWEIEPVPEDYDREILRF